MKQQESSIPLAVVCNYLNENLEKSPVLMTTLLSLVVKASVPELVDSRIFSTMTPDGGVALDILGFLSGLGDGSHAIIPDIDDNHVLRGFKTVSVNTDIDNWVK